MNQRRTYERINRTEILPTQQGFKLPFDKLINSVKIFQGYKSPWSHDSFLVGENKRLGDYRYSIDFALPYETEVLAPSTGTGYGLEDSTEDFYEGLDLETGMNTPANLIVLKHNTGVYSVLYHLKKDSFKVKEKDKVYARQPIALTGRSGWVSKTPHLHFAVFQFQEGGIQTFPVRFDNYSGELEHNSLQS